MGRWEKGSGYHTNPYYSIWLDLSSISPIDVETQETILVILLGGRYVSIILQHKRICF